MDPRSQERPESVWALARRQHGVVARRQLLARGLRPDAIKHRVRNGRLHPVRRGVYAVGRPALSLHGHWSAAVLACGEGAVLSHESAAALWGVRQRRSSFIEISARSERRVGGVVVHRRRPGLTPGEMTRRDGIPVTSLLLTFVDLASRLPSGAVEAAINEADKQDLVRPDELRSMLDDAPVRPGAARLRSILDRHTFTLTDSQLERLFLPIARSAGLGTPETGVVVNGFKVDFYWPALGLIVETDGLRYHRTPAQQARDRVRDQVNAAAGSTTLRFTHFQVAHQRDHVIRTLAAVARRLSAARGLT